MDNSLNLVLIATTFAAGTAATAAAAVGGGGGAPSAVGAYSFRHATGISFFATASIVAEMVIAVCAAGVWTRAT